MESCLQLVTQWVVSCYMQCSLNAVSWLAKLVILFILLTYVTYIDAHLSFIISFLTLLFSRSIFWLWFLYCILSHVGCPHSLSLCLSHTHMLKHTMQKNLCMYSFCFWKGDTNWYDVKNLGLTSSSVLNDKIYILFISSYILVWVFRCHSETFIQCHRFEI